MNPASDTVTILISSKMKAQNMGTYTLQEFKDGFAAMGVSTTDELKRKLPTLYQELKNQVEFTKMYKFVFDFARDKSFKNMNAEVAKDLWELLLSDKCKFFETWIKFLNES